MTGIDAHVLLQDFGDFMAPDLIAMFSMSIKPHWRTLDLLEHTEMTIHKVVRLRNPGARPPELICERISPDQVSITYSSARKLCAVAKGIVAGVARHYGDPIDVAEPASCTGARPAAISSCGGRLESRRCAWSGATPTRRRTNVIA